MEDNVKKIEARVGVVEMGLARMEAHVELIASDVEALKRDIKLCVKQKDLDELTKLCAKQSDELRNDLKALGRSLHRAEISGLFVAAGILGVLAKGFHWI